MKIAAAQIKVTDSKNNNLQRMLEYINKTKNADVICSPELSLQCDPNNVLSIQKDLKILSQATIKKNLNLIFGAYIKDKNKIRNRIFVMNRKGEVIHRYNKKHPFISEKDPISGGRKNNIFLLDNVPCAVINCWDYAFPEYGRDLAQKGAKIFFCPSYLLSYKQTTNVLEKSHR